MCRRRVTALKTSSPGCLCPGLTGFRMSLAVGPRWIVREACQGPVKQSRPSDEAQQLV